MKLLLPPLFAAGALVALAAEPPLAEFSNLTATAILGWYAWHTATRTLPRLVEDFRRELAAERALHRSDRDCFLRELAAEREKRQQALTDLRESIEQIKRA